MAKNKIELLLTGECKDGKIKWDNALEGKKFADHHEGQRIWSKWGLLTDLSEKEKLFAYLFGPLLDTLATALAHHGYGQLSKKDCYFIMKSRYGQKPWYNPLNKCEEIVFVDYSDEKTTKAELLEFVNNIILFIEQDLNTQAPDSDAYKTQMRLGSTKRKLSNDDNIQS